ncbi:MAG TPA: Na+/H+ antiporter subunit C [Devosiaceae bacterium]|nr:Na+/H+ antiporter subunit C [Devosiaceae bacterium]
MGTAFAILAGAFIAAAIYLLLARSMLRILFGLALLGNGINLLILVGGRLTRDAPPILSEGVTVPGAVANPLPQALILTAIVIGFALFTFLLTLAYRAYRVIGTIDIDYMRRAEPEAPPKPPLGY